MSPRTAFMSRLIGLYCILVSLAMLAHKRATVEMVKALFQNSPMLFVVGLLAVTAGLAMVLGHNVWSGGALPVIVTLVGWASLIKGVLFLFLSPETESRVFLVGLRFEEYFSFYAAYWLLLGTYLTTRGFRSTAPK
jgi:hypothetical protein